MNSQDWYSLLKIVGKKPFIVERVRFLHEAIAIEGVFELPPLAKLSAEDQIFVGAFVKSHGSIKEMERLFGSSYPTIKNRLSRISQELGFMDVKEISPRQEILDRLERGEIDASAAADLLQS